MPSISFTLPHWMFWGTLLVFPVIARLMYLRTKDHPESAKANVFLAYLFWLFGGFIGMHRVYLKSYWALLYLPLFVVVIWGGALHRDAREAHSAARQDVESLTRLADRAKASIARGKTSAQRQLDDAEKKLAPALKQEERAQAAIDHATLIVRAAALATLLLLLIDAALIPRLVGRARAREPLPSVPESEPHFEDDRLGAGLPGPEGRFVRGVDSFVANVGELASYWSVLAVFAYFFEVAGRYVFNSPTNWVHESTFLMFGMQYMIAGAYAYRGESHVRVDLVYSQLSERGKAICDVIGSVFFFIFIGVMLWTGWIFASQAFEVREVSFTEWGIQYWPVKMMIPFGALLMLLVGIARLIKDIHVLAGAGPRAKA